ncbi:hypothetical protein BDZ97DRAFT_1904916 [Flammula alnicola]|nr:hypothetical protein BDZ97DRAFT_1904916 [Flammula alnicola]
MLVLAVSLLFLIAQGNSTGLPIGSCTATIPCANGACCNSVSGFCGWVASVQRRDIAHLKLFSDLAQISVLLCLLVAHRFDNLYGTCTHLSSVNFAFALISEDFLLQEMNVNDNLLWVRTTALKQKNPALKVFLSVGGWSFNDPPTQHIFSNLVGSLDATNTFIENTLSILQAYGFDGIDIDWEYPVAPERGGVPADRANYPIFMSRVKAAFAPRGYGLTFTAPSSYWYLQHFDLPSLLESADWVNIMTYDLHGTWDSTDPFIGPFVLAHTNLTEIMETMQLFRNVGVNPSQMVMGIGFYGRSFTLVDGQCNTPGCPFSGGGDPGECSLSSGTLMFSEIEKLLDTTSDLIPVFDEAAAVKYITWNDNQWVSYDDAQTLQMKLNYANSICLGAGYTNCRWVGDPPNCLNAVCSAGQIAIFSDIQGDASSQCVGNNKRFYCCDPPAGSSFLPIPVTDVFPATGDGFNVDQPATFTVDFDDNTGTSDTSSTGTGSSGIGDDGEENDSAFGEVFISSPNPGSVSSMDIASDWVVTNCSPTSDQPQTVLAYCSKGMDDEDSGCGHIFIGQTEHTIIRMPKSCGLGPYARVVSLTEHPDQNALPQEHQTRKRSTEKVYSLSFDYNFLAVPEENGPVLMRADVVSRVFVWYRDAIIDSPPDPGTTNTKRRRDFHQPLEYEKRWFGPFDSWLQKLTTVRSGDTVSRNYHWSDTYTIFHAEQQCPHFSSSLDISVTGTAQITSQFGYYLEATIVPPSIQQAYVFFDAGAGAQASFTITGLAEAHYGSGRQELATFGFPGLYYPGLLTLGPSLHLYGELTGQLSLSGRYTATVGYTFPPISYAFGLADNNPDEEDPSDNVDSNSNNVGYDFSVGYNVNLEGSLDIPSLQLGINVLGGSLIDAELFAEADMYVGVSISGSVNQASAPQFCVNPHYGVDLNAGLTGSVLFWRPNPIVKNFFSADFPFGGSCFNSVTEASASGNSRRGIGEPFYAYEAHGSGQLGLNVSSNHDLNVPAYAITSGQYADILARGRAGGTATMGTCPAYFLDMSGYSSTDIGTFFDVKPADQVSPTFGTYNPWPPNIEEDPNGNPVLTSAESGGAIFAREHVYEVSMASLFIDHLQQFTDLWQIQNGPSWCQWVNQNLRSGTNSVFELVQNCYPGGSNGATAMVMLEQQANVFKNYAFYETERQLVPGGGNTIRLVDPTKWANMCPTKQVARLRAAAGIPSYLNNFNVQQLFKRDNTCIRNIWIAWYNNYQQLSPARGPNPSNVNVPNIYDNFVYNILNGVVPYLKAQIPNYIQTFNPGQADTATQDVRVSFAIELDYWTDHENGDPNSPWDNNAAPKADLQVSRTQLTQSILNAIPSITWLNTLPTH